MTKIAINLVVLPVQWASAAAAWAVAVGRPLLELLPPKKQQKETGGPVAAAAEWWSKAVRRRRLLLKVIINSR